MPERKAADELMPFPASSWHCVLKPLTPMRVTSSLSCYKILKRQCCRKMLVLTRKPGESIVIGDQIEVTVISVEGEAIRIGINAPRQVTVYRKEIVEAIRAENLRAARSAARLGKDLSRLLKEPES